MRWPFLLFLQKKISNAMARTFPSELDHRPNAVNRLAHLHLGEAAAAFAKERRKFPDGKTGSVDHIFQKGVGDITGDI